MVFAGYGNCLVDGSAGHQAGIKKDMDGPFFQPIGIGGVIHNIDFDVIWSAAKGIKFTVDVDLLHGRRNRKGIVEIRLGGHADIPAYQCLALRSRYGRGRGYGGTFTASGDDA